MKEFSYYWSTENVTETHDKQQECTLSNIQIGITPIVGTYVQKLEKSLIETGSFNRKNAVQQQPRVNQHFNEVIEKNEIEILFLENTWLNYVIA